MSNIMKSIVANSRRPAPKFYRKFENMMIIVLIPAIVFVINDWGFANELKAKRILLIVGTLLPAVIKGVGMIMANGDDYVEPKKENDAV